MQTGGVANEVDVGPRRGKGGADSGGNTLRRPRALPLFPHRWPYSGFPYYAPLIGAYPAVARAPCVPQPSSVEEALQNATSPLALSEDATNFGSCQCRSGAVVPGVSDSLYVSPTPKGSCSAGFDPVCSHDNFCTCADAGLRAEAPATAGELLRSDVRAGCGMAEDTPCCP